ncbi:MAG: hypothetical protein M3164_05190 [Actinomycetota bacterium]|nr:hypothetical protein [Actinomycetota bacterium]
MPNHPSPTALVACDDPALLDQVLRYLDQTPNLRILPPAHSRREVLGALSSQRPDCVLISESLVLELASAVNGSRSISANLIVFGPDGSLEGLKAAMRIGCRDYIEWPAEQLRIRTLLEADSSLRRTPNRPLASLNAVWAPKGGSGASVISAHLAAALAQAGAECVLADLDVNHGDQTVILSAEQEKKTLGDLLRVAEDVTPSMVESVLWAHPDGFRVILAPGAAAELADSGTRDILRLLEIARRGPDHIVVDLPSGVGELVTGVLQAATTVFAVLTPDLLSLRRARDSFQRLRREGLDTSRWVGLLNQAGGTDVTERDVESVLGVTSTVRIKADLQIYRAANRGHLSATGRRLLAPIARELVGSVASWQQEEALPRTRLRPAPAPTLALETRGGTAARPAVDARPPLKW